MKLQGLSIIFGLIVIPIVLVLSYFIQLQVDTITLQTSYDTKLLDATHDAMAAFELNTANEDLSSVADSLRTIIDASSNIFVNTLATNLGLSNASKSRIQAYIPSILYTLYDGYYICSPTRKQEIGTDLNGVALEIDEKKDGTNDVFTIAGLTYDSTIDGYGVYRYDPTDTTNHIITTSVPDGDFGQLLYKRKDGKLTTNINSGKNTPHNEDDDVLYTIEYVLKSYMPYSAKYIDDTKNIDITINYTLDNYITIIGNIGKVYYTKSGYLIKKGLVEFSTYDGSVDLSNYNENDAENMILAGTKVTVVIDGQQITTDGDVNSDKTKAVIYYTKAKLFSDWVYNNLSTIKEENITEIYSIPNEKASSEKGTTDVVYSFEGKEDLIFSPIDHPESESSIFVNHKFQVIRNSIQYNLNLAMSIYNQSKTTTYDFKMPIISDEEWHKIMTNISIVSFMEGLNCGLKTYNNYEIVSSTNNELTVTPNEIYFVEKSLFNDENTTYHRIDCPLLEFPSASLVAAGLPEANQQLTSFVSKEVKYDKIYDKATASYLYDHKNLACYTCIVDGNYIPQALTNEKKLYYYIGLGKQRYDIYKMNAINPSEGYEIIVDSNASLSDISTRGLNEIKKIEVVFGNIVATDTTENVVRLFINGDGFPVDLLYSLNTNQSKEQTIVIDVNSNSSAKVNLGTIHAGISNQNNPTSIKDAGGDPNNKIRGAIKSVKVIYK